MMLNPKDYRKEFEADTLDTILNERDRIIEFMHDFENDKLPQKYFELDTSPETAYLTHIDYLKEICDLIKIKRNEENSKSVPLSPFLAIENIISKLDEEKKKQFLEDLKNKDSDLYYKYIEWKALGKMNGD